MKWNLAVAVLLVVFTANLLVQYQPLLQYGASFVCGYLIAICYSAPLRRALWNQPAYTKSR